MQASETVIERVSAILLVLIAVSWSTDESGATQSQLANGKALEFKVSKLDGDPFDTGSLKGKIVLMDFWVVWCLPCVKAFPKLNRLQQDYKKQNFEVLGIALFSGTREDVGAFIKDHDVRYTMLIGNDDIAEKFGVIGFPSYFLIDQNGNIYKQYIGDLPDLYNEISKDISTLDKLNLSGEKEEE